MTFVRVVLVLVALPALSAPAPETFLERTWHEVEVLLFLDPGEEPLVHEDLWREQPRPYSGRLIALLDEDERNVARLGSRTRNDLLQLDRVDLGVHAESRPDWMPPLGSSWESVAGSTLSSLGVPDLFVAWMLRPSPEVDTEFGEFDEQDEAPGTTMQDVADAFHAYEEQLDLTTYRWERANLVMANAASRLRRRGYEVLDHGRWHQELRSDGDVESVFLYAGKNRADRLYQVEGTVTYTQKRFPELAIDVWFADEHSIDDPGVVQSSPQTAFFRLSETRFVLPRRIQYFDHPKAGVLVWTNEVPIPNHLQELVESLDETLGGSF